MPHETITPDRDGWYWAIRSAWPELPGLLEVVRLTHGRVWIAGNEVEDRPEDWRFYAGPIEPPKLDLAVTGRSVGQAGRSLVVLDTYPVLRQTGDDLAR